MEDCIFCKILAGELEASVVYQDEDVSAFMDIQPINAGHTLVIPNRHISNLSGLDKAIGKKIFEVGQQITAAIYASDLPSEGVNLFLADGKAAGQEVFHVHLHIIPRKKGDGFGFRFGPAYYELPERSELDQAAALIRKII